MRDLERNGFTWARGAASGDLPHVTTGERNHRHALELPEVAAYTQRPWLRALVHDALGAPPFCVRAILFDKTPLANWGVPWHQDRTIAVRARVEVEHFGPWSVKGGIVHTLAPDSVLTRMVATRLHLDDCGPEEGPLRVVPATHPCTLTDDAVAQRARDGFTSCTALRGDVLLMRPLLVHASSKATSLRRRRVLHLEWACDPLPTPLRWRWT